MKQFSDDINEILADAYHSLLMMEEIKRKYSRGNFSFRDRNAIAFLKKHEDGKKISEIADFLKISRPSATLVIKKLEKNGLVTKRIDPDNERNIIVTLTRKGTCFSSYQDRYRKRMAGRISEGFSEEEKRALYNGLVKLNDFFVSSIEESEAIHNNKNSK